MTFQGKLIRFGGVFPIRVLRLFRNGRGSCENRWMDEHIKVAGLTENFSGEIIDDNLNSLTWWTAKHNGYASREAVDLLNLKYRFMPHDSVAGLRKASQAGVKRWIKESIYTRLPGGFRAFTYFFLSVCTSSWFFGWLLPAQRSISYRDSGIAIWSMPRSLRWNAI